MRNPLGGEKWGKNAPKMREGNPQGWGLLWLKMGRKWSKKKKGWGGKKNKQKEKRGDGEPPGVGAVVKKQTKNQGKMVKNETENLRAEVIKGIDRKERKRTQKRSVGHTELWRVVRAPKMGRKRCF